VGGLWRDEGESLVLHVPLDGFRRRDVTVEVAGDVLVVRAHRARGIFDCTSESFEERCALPAHTELSTVAADFNGGVLSVRVAKASTASRRVPITIRDPSKQGSSGATLLTSPRVTAPDSFWRRTWARVRSALGGALSSS
jgi:hypothetical protein